jgi:hypothetical protein
VNDDTPTPIKTTHITRQNSSSPTQQRVVNLHINTSTHQQSSRSNTIISASSLNQHTNTADEITVSDDTAAEISVNADTADEISVNDDTADEMSVKDDTADEISE